VGYNTDYQLTITHIPEDVIITTGELSDKIYEFLEKSLDKNSGYYEESLNYLRQLADDISNNGRYIGKWYSHFNTMKEVSSKFPGVRFKLVGEGEEPDDRWKAYFENGKGFKFTQNSYAHWLIKKFGGDNKKLYEEFIESNLK